MELFRNHSKINRTSQQEYLSTAAVIVQIFIYQLNYDIYPRRRGWVPRDHSFLRIGGASRKKSWPISINVETDCSCYLQLES